MKAAHFHIVVFATIIIASGCSPISTATRRTGLLLRMVAVDTPLRVADSLHDAVGRMDSTGVGLSSQAQFERDTGSGGDTAAKTIHRQIK